MKFKNAAVKTLEIIAAIAILVLVVLWMSGTFHEKIEPGETERVRVKVPPGAEVAVVEEQRIPLIEEASGTVEAKRKTIVSSRIMASIRDIKVRAGDEVTAGETLVELDNRDLAARTQQAERAVEAAQASLDKAKADFERAKELFSRNVIGRSEYETSESAFKVAEANLGSARKNLEEAEVAISYADIPSPVSGRIVERYADPGDTTSPGQPLLSVYDPQSLRIEAPIRESILSRIKIGDALNVRLGDSKEMIMGKVGEIVPEAEIGSRTFLVKVDLPFRENIYTGMFARIQIPAGERERLVLDRRAVMTIGQLNYVDVVNPEGTISRRLITLGQPTDENQIEILSGLNKGEKVVIAGA